MAANTEFFGKRNAQAVLKHGILTRYAVYFSGRAGSATAGRVAFIDGYAGEGRYEDGSPGSPLLLASQARRSEMFGRDVKLAVVEPNAARRQRLAQSLVDAGVAADQVLAKPFEDVADSLLDRYWNRAVLLFVDPFGLAIPRSTLERLLRGRSAKRPIDVLYHFSLSSVARMGRAGVVQGPSTEQNARRIDNALGDIDWRGRFRTATEPDEPTEAAISVARTFGRAVGEATEVQNTGILVHQRPDQLPKYYLMLFSANQKAHWDYADLASRAHEDWLHHCDRQDYEAYISHREEGGLLELFAQAEPNADDIAEQIKVEAADYLPAHLTDLLMTRGSVRPMDEVEAVYGTMLGRARATHVRSALKVLHQAGRIQDNAKGDFWRRSIRWVDTSA